MLYGELEFAMHTVKESCGQMVFAQIFAESHFEDEFEQHSRLTRFVPVIYPETFIPVGPAFVTYT